MRWMKHSTLGMLLLLAACSDRGPVAVDHVWLELPDTMIAAEDSSQAMSGFLEVRNPGAEPVQLVTIASKAFREASIEQQVDGRWGAVASLTIAPRSRMKIDGRQLRLRFHAPQVAISDGDHLALSMVFQIADGQLLSLESELHVHADHDSAEHAH